MAERAPSPISPAEIGLERALLFNFTIHALALAGMAALLLPTLPGGSAADEAARILNIAQHPWRFRLGWLPWQLCAVADLWLAIAMVRVRFLPRAGSVAVLLLTLAAVVPDQYAQLVWVTHGVELAQTDPRRYLALESAIFPLTAGWGALFYTLAALGWTYCFARAGTWSRALTWLSVPLWSCMGAAVISPLLPASIRPGSSTISSLNGAGFLMLQVWLGLVTERVLERHRPYQAYGRLARWASGYGGRASPARPALQQPPGARCGRLVAVRAHAKRHHRCRLRQLLARRRAGRGAPAARPRAAALGSLRPLRVVHVPDVSASRLRLYVPR